MFCWQIFYDRIAHQILIILVRLTSQHSFLHGSCTPNNLARGNLKESD